MAYRTNTLVGKKIGKLKVVCEIGRVRRAAVYRCHCDCGNFTQVCHGNLQSGHTTSCGCKRVLASTKHGSYQTPTYRIWAAMKQRCFNPHSSKYECYGGRGIKVCKRWAGKNGFKNFLDDMGERPKGKELDRRNNDGNYEPNNCRWVSIRKNRNNTRSNVVLSLGGRRRTIAQWSRKKGINPGTLWDRLNRGWPIEKALNTPVKLRLL